MKRTMLTAMLLGTLFGQAAEARTLAQIKASGTLVVATEGGYAPFNEMKPGAKEPTGFEIDVVNGIAKEMGLKVKWVTGEFGGLLNRLAKGEFDMVAASHTITPERQKLVNFSSPHYCTSTVILTRQGGPMNKRDLYGVRVGAEKNSTTLEYGLRMGGIRLFAMKDTQAGVDGLSRKTIDAYITELFPGLQAMKDNPKAGLQISAKALWNSENGMAFRKGAEADALRSAINASLAKMLKDGSYQKLSESYFGRDIRC